MPFKSKAQMRACFAKGDKNWDCKEFADKTKNIKDLPERKKTAEFYCNTMLDSFTKVAKKLFNPVTSPAVPREKVEARVTSQAVQNTVAKRNKNVERRRGTKPASFSTQ